MKRNPSNTEIYLFLDEAERKGRLDLLADLLEGSFDIPKYMADEFIKIWREQNSDESDHYIIRLVHIMDGDILEEHTAIGYEELRRVFRQVLIRNNHPAFQVIALEFKP